MNIKRYFNRGIFALTLLASTTACQQDEALQQPEADNGSRIIRAVIEQPTDTRTAVDHTSGAFSWVVNDEIQLLCGTKGADGSVTVSPTTITSVDADGKGTFSLDGATDVIGAVYPAIFATDWKVDDNGVPTSVHLPHEYTYGNVNAPMYAVLDGESTTARFKHLAGVMAITVTDVPANVDRFVFEANQRITGAFNVANDTEGNPCIQTDGAMTDTDNTVTIGFTETTAPVEKMTFYIPLPVGEYNTFTVKLYGTGTDKKVYVKEATSGTANNIKRCTLGIMPEATLDKTTTGYDLKNNTYIVYTAEGLKAVNKEITDNLDSYSDRNITLAEDIVLPALADGETSNWTSIGTYTTPYSGIFNGNRKHITGLIVNGKSIDNQGLIGIIGYNGTVKDLTLISPTVTSISGAGSIAGENLGIINNCHVRGEAIITGGNNVGGIVGTNWYMLSGCTVNGNVSVTGGNFVGGLVGYSLDFIIKGCIVSDCTVKGNNYIGGIVGQLINNSEIMTCLAHKVKLILNNSTTTIGGITGYAYSSSIVGCYAYQCSYQVKGEEQKEFEGVQNIIYDPSKITITQCYYENWVANGSGTFGGYNSDGTAAETDWKVAMTKMNAAIDAANPTVKYHWSGTQTEPELTKVE